MLDSTFALHPDYLSLFPIDKSARHTKRVQVTPFPSAPSFTWEGVAFRLVGPDPPPPFQCARVSVTSNRSWVRLVSNRHDLQLWEPDERQPVARKCKRSVASLGQKEEWMKSILTYLQARQVRIGALMAEFEPRPRLSLTSCLCSGFSMGWIC